MSKWFSNSGMFAALGLSQALAGAACAANLPEDVTAFVEERQQCDHFRGEEPYDASRQAEIDAMLERYCRGTDAQLAALRAKYRGISGILVVLDTFEARIEP